MKKYYTTRELAKMFKVCNPTVWKNFDQARVEGTLSQIEALYSTEKIIDLIEASSGYRLKPEELHDLVRRQEAVEMLADAGRPRTERSFSYWAANNIGPRLIRVGKTAYYLRSEVIDFLPHLTEGNAKYGAIYKRHDGPSDDFLSQRAEYQIKAASRADEQYTVFITEPS